MQRDRIFIRWTVLKIQWKTPQPLRTIHYLNKQLHTIEWSNFQWKKDDGNKIVKFPLHRFDFRTFPVPMPTKKEPFAFEKWWPNRRIKLARGNDWDLSFWHVPRFTYNWINTHRNSYTFFFQTHTHTHVDWRTRSGRTVRHRRFHIHTQLNGIYFYIYIFFISGFVCFWFLFRLKSAGIKCWRGASIACDNWIGIGRCSSANKIKSTNQFGIIFAVR